MPYYKVIREAFHAKGYFWIMVTLCSPTVAASTRAGRAKRESMPISGYFGLRYLSTNISRTKAGTSTPSSETEST